MVQGAIRAAAAAGVHCIIQFSARTVRHYGARTLANAVRGLADRWNAPVYVHLDHCADEAILADAVGGGFDGIMVDGSHLEIEQNVLLTRRWVVRAHDAGLVVEAELGAIGGVEDDVVAGPEDSRLEAEQVLEFADRTGVDLVGTNIGTAHGLYDAPPSIDFPLVERMILGLSAGLVVHGGSGLSEETLNRFARLGVAKVNFSTDLKIAWAAAVRAALETGDAPEPLACSRSAEDSVLEICTAKIRALCG
jgi:tagatose 1,6-diphosphate aldolase GatY/KbaY